MEGYLGYILAAIVGLFVGTSAFPAAASTPSATEAVPGTAWQTAFSAQPLNLWLLFFVVLAVGAVFFIAYLIHSGTLAWRLQTTLTQKFEDESNEIKENQHRTHDQFITQMLRTENLRDISGVLVPLTKEKE